MKGILTGISLASLAMAGSFFAGYKMRTYKDAPLETERLRLLSEKSAACSIHVELSSAQYGIANMTPPEPSHNQ
jgi:hypothetical protein